MLSVVSISYILIHVSAHSIVSGGKIDFLHIPIFHSLGPYNLNLKTFLIFFCLMKKKKVKSHGDICVVLDDS